MTAHGVTPNDTRSPLSPSQLRLWLLHQLDPASAAYTMTRSYRLQGRLSSPALETALAAIVERHHSLRTTFDIRGGEPVQEVSANWRFRLGFTDLSRVPDEQREREAQTLVTADAERPFDLSRDLLLRGTLIRVSDLDHLLVISQHHIASDRWSVRNLHRELEALYEAGVTGVTATLPVLSLQYIEHARNQHSHVRSEAITGQLMYWRQHLAGVAPFLELPADRSLPQSPTMAAGYLTRVISPETVRAAEGLARSQRATPFMVLTAAWMALLHRYTGESDLVIGSPTAGRLSPDLEPLIGFFANTLVLRTDVTGNPTFVELVQRVRRTALEAYARQEVPFEQIVEALNPVRDQHRNPVVQVLIGYENASEHPLRLYGLQVDEIGRHTAVVPFQLDVAMTRAPQGLRVRIAYQAELFLPSTIERWLTHFGVLLEGAVRNPDARLYDLPLLPREEQQTLEATVQGSTAPMGSASTVDQLFAEQLQRTPDRIAIADGSTLTSFGKLDARASSLAARLMEVGVGPGDRVALLLDRSTDALVAMLGIMRTGAAYVPIHPAHPRLWQAAVLETIRPAAVVTSPHHRAALAFEGPIVDVTTVASIRVPLATARRAPDDSCYVLFTSGSTGRPKGVDMPHAALVNLIGWHQRHERLGVPSRTLQFAPLTFDVSFQEVFTTWCTGGTVVVVDGDTRRDPAALLSAIARERIDRLYMPFVALRQLAETARRSGVVPPGLRDIVSAGEVLHLHDDIRFLVSAANGCRLHNHYGPTEAHVVTALTLPADIGRWPVTAPLGRPIDGARVEVIDAALNPAPIGVAGQIAIGGVCLARGYVDQPALTGERFVTRPAPAEIRLYLTGDRGRWTSDGTLEFLGRTDDQVKIRGVRVEPGQIEAVLGEHPAVRACAVDVRSDADSGLRLVAYAIAEDGADPGHLTAFLRERLPEAMVPSAVVLVNDLPRTTSDKVDRAKLPDPDTFATRTPAPSRPLTDTEATVLRIWRDTLRRPDVGPDDDFFEAGGHSLLGVRLFARVEEATGCRLPLSTLFKGASVAAVARALDAARSRRPWTPVVAISPKGTRPPLFLVHGIGGEVLTFRKLAARVSDRPVYGIEAAGPGTGGEHTVDLEALAARYADEIVALTPDRPVHIGGYSSGGVLALAVAQELRRRGRDVGMLVVIDGGLPGFRGHVARARHTPISLMRQIACWMADDAFRTGAVEWIGRLRSKARAFVRRTPHADANDMQVRDLLGMWRIPDEYEAYVRMRYDAFLSYVPSPYPGCAMVIRSRTGRLLAPPLQSRDDRWCQLLTGPLDLCYVPGSHHNVLESPFVEHVAAAIERGMSAADRSLVSAG